MFTPKEIIQFDLRTCFKWFGFQPPTRPSMFFRSWNPKQPFINGCFNWMIPNLYIGNGCFTKHPFINGCLGFQVVIQTSPKPVSDFSKTLSSCHWFFSQKTPGIPWKIPDVQNQAGRDGGDNGEHLRHAENVIPFLRFFFQNPGLNDYRYILQGSLTGNHFWGGSNLMQNLWYILRYANL